MNIKQQEMRDGKKSEAFSAGENQGKSFARTFTSDAPPPALVVRARRAEE